MGTGHIGSAQGSREFEEDYARAEQVVTDERKAFRALPKAGFDPPAYSRTRQNISEKERLVSAATGAGLVALGLVRGRLEGLLLGGLGSALIWRGYTGRCQCYAALGIDTAEHNPVTSVPAQQGEKVERTVSIHCSPERLYRFWRQLENLPRVMSHLSKVEQLDSQRSHWVAKGPLDSEIEWDAEIHNERANELIAWRSLPGGDIGTAGSVHFRPARQPGVTELTLSMKYTPPAGRIGACIAEWLGEGMEQRLEEDLQRLKQVMEIACANEKPAAEQTITS
jgi:uncharacterized membrane protein